MGREPRDRATSVPQTDRQMLLWPTHTRGAGLGTLTAVWSCGGQCSGSVANYRRKYAVSPKIPSCPCSAWSLSPAILPWERSGCTHSKAGTGTAPLLLPAHSLFGFGFNSDLICEQVRPDLEGRGLQAESPLRHCDLWVGGGGELLPPSLPSWS